MFILLTRHTDVTKVWFTELDYWEVKETPEHIMNLIKHK